MNNRSDFRIHIDNKRCLVRSNLYVPEAQIDNISGTGMSIIVADNKLLDIFDIQFSVLGRSFTRKVSVEWIDALSDGNHIYGLSFIDQTDAERVYLHSVLMTEAARMYQKQKNG